ncbi:hypothetical protein DMUE_0369 [Dictyocoela muelleri]|nr:hypothetical protein DMUE_0369 [Dictyocoela muelleri]
MKKYPGILWKLLIGYSSIRLIQVIITRIYSLITNKSISIVNNYIHVVLSFFRLITIGKINKKPIFILVMISYMVETCLFLLIFIKSNEVYNFLESILPLVSFGTMIFFHPCYLGDFKRFRGELNEKKKED